MTKPDWRLVRRRLAGRVDEMVELTSTLVKIDTSVPPGENYLDLVNYLTPLVERAGFEPSTITVPDEILRRKHGDRQNYLVGARANLLGRRHVANVPRVAFYTHIDTVPVGDVSAWDFAPLSGDIDGSYVYGRGAADSKGPIAAMLTAFAVLAELEIPLAVEPLLALTSDEELGTYSGLMYMCDIGVFEGCAAMLSVDGMAENIAIGRLGSFTWRIDVYGKAVHSGRACLGKNPITSAAPLIEELRRLAEVVDGRRGALRTSPEFVRLSGRETISPSLNVTMASGSPTETMIPGTFVLRGDRRYLPEEDEEDCIEELRGVIRRAQARDAGLSCKLSVTPFYPSYAADPNHPWITKLRSIVGQVRGSEVELGAAMGSSDSAYAARATRMVVAQYGADWEDSHAHSPNEKVNAEDLLITGGVVAAVATGLLDESRGSLR